MSVWYARLEQTEYDPGGAQMTDNQNSNQPPPQPPQPPPPIEATPQWTDPFEYVEVKGSQGQNVERRDIHLK
jgi:hypothetical protein